jgi:hypothetical protein
MFSVMTRKCLLGSLMLLGLLGACERGEVPHTPPLPEPLPVPLPPIPALPTAPVSVEVPTLPAARPAPPPQASKKAVSGGPRPTAPATKRPSPVKLDLSLPEELVERLEPLEPATDAELLPRFFENDEQEFFKLHGRLITNEGDGGQGLDGAELRFEFKR